MYTLYNNKNSNQYFNLKKIRWWIQKCKKKNVRT